MRKIAAAAAAYKNIVYRSGVRKAAAEKTRHTMQKPYVVRQRDGIPCMGKRRRRKRTSVRKENGESTLNFHIVLKVLP